MTSVILVLCVQHLEPPDKVPVSSLKACNFSLPTPPTWTVCMWQGPVQCWHWGTPAPTPSSHAGLALVPVVLKDAHCLVLAGKEIITPIDLWQYLLNFPRKLETHWTFRESSASFLNYFFPIYIWIFFFFFYCNCFLFRRAMINTVVLCGLPPSTYYTLTIFILVNFCLNLSIVIFFSSLKPTLTPLT